MKTTPMKMINNLRQYLGIILLIAAWFIPLLGFWVASLNLALPVKSTIIGLLTVGGPEILAIAAVALLGKQAFDAIASKLLSVLGRLAPHGVVSRQRYRIGLLLFVVTFIPTYIQGYFPYLLPDSSPARLYVNLCADLLFITSLFILGGDFWDKLKALFIYDAKAQFPN